MVLSSLISPASAEKRPYEFMLFGFIYTSLGIFLSLWVFREETSMVMIVLTVMASAPFMMNLLKLEEKKVMILDKEPTVLHEHVRAINVYGFLFIGFTIAFAVWYMFLPTSSLYDVFRIQQGTLTEITGGAATAAVSSTFDYFLGIFLNNVKVLVFCVLFSFIYGMGAIFILTWNASVLGTAMGSLIKKFVVASGVTGVGTVGAYTLGFGMSIVRYSVHGVPEILAYLVAGLAGGIISMAIVNHDIKSDKFYDLVMDSANLILAAMLILLIAGILEAWITPPLFDKVMAALPA